MTNYLLRRLIRRGQPLIGTILMVKQDPAGAPFPQEKIRLTITNYIPVIPHRAR